MADLGDMAQDRAALDLASALRVRRPAGPAPEGRCLNCGTRLRRRAARWCDADCRDDWQREQGRVTA